MIMIMLTEMILICNFTYTLFSAYRFSVTGGKIWTTWNFSAHRLLKIRGDIVADHLTI
jgi:hypothetical protein